MKATPDSNTSQDGGATAEPETNLWQKHAHLFDDPEQITVTDEAPVEFERQEPTFYARIPKLATMTLNPYELALYTHYKQTASDNGYCSKSNKTLAAEAQMSVSKVKDARQSLLEKGFISAVHHPDDDGNVNQPPTVKIIDIWQKNHETYSVGVVTKKQGGGHQKTTPGHQKTPKNNQYKKNLSKKDSGASDDAGASRKEKPRNPVFDAVAFHIFSTDPTRVNGKGGRIGAISSWLEGKNAGMRNINVGFISEPATADDVVAFATWYKLKTDGKLDMPQGFPTFVEWWRKWETAGKPAAPQPVSRPKSALDRAFEDAQQGGAE